MPDVFVGLDKDKNSKYFISLFNKGLITQYAFDYVDKNRITLKTAYTDAVGFVTEFSVDKTIFDEFILYAEKNGIKKDDSGIALSGKNIKSYLKAFIGRNLFDDEAFYPTLNLADETVLKAVEMLDAAN